MLRLLSILSILLAIFAVVGMTDQDLARALGAEVRGAGRDFLVLRGSDPGAFARYGRVVHDFPSHALAADPLEPSQWALPVTKLPDAWNLTPGSPAIIVAVIDSGLDASNPDFDPARIIRGTDYVDPAGHDTDATGHGTYVAGIIGATRGNGIGIAGAANVTLLVIRVLDATNSGSCLNVALAVVEAMRDGARVINLSLSCPAQDPVLELAIRQALEADVIVVAAAGNGYGTPGACPAFPAGMQGVLSVGASDGGGQPASFSCGGVDLLAPGVDVLSTYRGGFASLSGTSAAAPHVSATAALVAGLHPTWTGPQVRQAVLNGCTPPKLTLDHTGCGPVDAAAAATWEKA